MVRFTWIISGGLCLVLTSVGWTPRAAAGPSPPSAKSASRTVKPSMCVAHYRARRYRAARQCFRALLSRVGSDAQMLYAIGYASYQLGEHRAALGSFARVLALQPADGDALFMSGLASARLGRHRQALRFMVRALRVGLKSESPAEARRHVRLLKKVLAGRLRSGWLWSSLLTLGYDSHPRLEGSAASAGTSDGSAAEGSGFAAVALGLGHRWTRGLRRIGDRTLRGALSLAYRFGQSVVFSDLSRTGGVHGGWRSAEVTGGASLQTHHVGLAARLLGHRWDVGLGVATRAELSGLRDFTPLLAGGDLEADLNVRWHALTQSHLAVSYRPQWALASAAGYLSGHGLVSGLRQSLRYKRLRLAVGYGLGIWWLGRVVTPLSECTAGQACGLDVPFANHEHRALARLGLKATAWLALQARVSVAHRTYWGTGEYRLATGGLTERRRYDLIQSYRLKARFPLYQGLTLALVYDFTRCRSTIDEQSIGIEEGYDRHRVWVSLGYSRW